MLAGKKLKLVILKKNIQTNQPNVFKLSQGRVLQ